LETHDVIVVGAGPAGNYAAYCLARLGYDVLVLQEHQRVGEPVDCSGLIGAEAFERYDLPRRSILRGFDRARFISPGGCEAVVSAHRTVAYVVDLGEFDRSLAEQAQAAGATYRLGSRCVGISPVDWGVRATVSEAGGGVLKLGARAAILGTGVRYGVLQALGGSRPGRFLNTAQAELAMRDVNEVEVYLGREISPGSFAWAIPVDGQRVKLGMCNHGRVLTWMEWLLEHPRVLDRPSGRAAGDQDQAYPHLPSASDLLRPNAARRGRSGPGETHHGGWDLLWDRVCRTCGGDSG
jgi:flavin-dependent dehydrogenase